MCTAISLTGNRHLAGRTLDLECTLGENLTLTPEQFPLSFLYGETLYSHHALLGVAHIEDGQPLYYDAINNKGLFAAGLNFPHYARYYPQKQGFINLASFEVIPYILSLCSDLSGAAEELKRINITPDSFSESLPSTPMHWFFADSKGSLVAEPDEGGLRVYENPFGVLTNSPPFPHHILRLADFSALSPAPPENNISVHPIPLYSRGLGASGLPGDWSSISRFVRGVYASTHTKGENDIGRFFHVADTVSVPMGCIQAENGRDVYTVYTSCGDTSRFAYYLTTYESDKIFGYKPTGGELTSNRLIVKNLPRPKAFVIFKIF